MLIAMATDVAYALSPRTSTSALFFVVVTIAYTASATATGLSSVRIPLHHGSIDGALTDTPYTIINLGTPPSSAAVLIDTGSATLAVPPPDYCATFGVPAQYPLCPSSVSPTTLRTEGVENPESACVIGAYNAELSRTAEILSTVENSSNPFESGDYVCGTPGQTQSGQSVCLAGVQYGSKGSQSNTNCGQGFEGYLATDILQLGSGDEAVSARVSLVVVDTIQSGFQESPAAGIMGIGLTKLNELSANGLWQTDDFTTQPNSLTTLLKSNGLQDQFSLCMGNESYPGTLVLGDTIPEFADGDFANVPMQTNRGYYGINVKYVGLYNSTYTIEGMPSHEDQENLYSNLDVVVVDSGTPELQLPESIYDSINNAAIPCITDADCALKITVEGMDGAEVELEVPGVMTCSDKCASGACCSDLNQFASRGGGILGYAVLRNYYTVFRRDPSQYTFGFAKPTSKCGSLRGVSTSVISGKQTNNDSNLSTYHIIGIVAGVIVGLFLIAGCVWCVCTATGSRTGSTSTYAAYANQSNGAEMLVGSSNPYSTSVSNDGYAGAAQ